MKPVMPTTTTPQSDGSQQERLPHLPGLDGLRAIAVIGVLIYHAGLPLLGGFLGVETFFTLSGFLITALLMAEWRSHGAIDLAAFWIRRARRLLPALFLLLAATLMYAAIALPEEMEGLWNSTVAAVGYFMNWHLIGSGQSYFDPTLRPSLLQHLWSLAVEEQFYLLWPLLFVIGMRFLKLPGVVVMVFAGIVASSGLMMHLYDPGTDPSRVYYGTDTRAAGLLIGVALGLLWSPWRAPKQRSKVIRWTLDGLGLAALVGLCLAYLWIQEQHPWLYLGGFTLVSLLTVSIIAAATYPDTTIVPQLLGLAPFRWAGTRSYSLYLWHWPIFQLTRPYQDVMFDGLPLLALRLGVTVLFAEVSYRWVELPARHGGIGQAIQRVGGWLTPSYPQAALGIVAFSTGHAAPMNHAVKKTLGMRNAKLSGSWVLISICALVLSGSGCSFGPPSAASVPTAVIAQGPSAVPATTIPEAAADIRATSTTSAIAVPAATASAESTATTAATATTQSTATVESSATTAATATSESTTTAEASPTSAALQPIDPALAADLQRVLDQLVADGRIPGALVAVNISGYETWVGASGVMSRKTGQPMQPDTHYRIASISKVFTAVTVLRLVEEGKIDLDAPVATYLPDVLKNGESITVRNLLQHTSGLFDYLEDRSFVNRAYREPNREWQPAELVAYAEGFPALFKPGAKGAWDYSSTNYVLLGMIVEKVTGNSMAQELRRLVLEPLQLNNTFFVPYEEIQGTLANGYSNTIDQNNISLSFAYSTANIVSTVDDVNRFGQALFKGELLQPETMEQMTTFVSGKGQYNMPALQYGLGVMYNVLPVGPDANGQKRPTEASAVLGHIGGFGGFRSALWHAPEQGITVSLGINQAATDPNILATQVYDAILRSQGR